MPIYLAVMNLCEARIAARLSFFPYEAKIPSKKGFLRCVSQEQDNFIDIQ